MTTEAALNPTTSLLIKLGSALVHYEEYLDPVHGHPFDKTAAESIMSDREVKEWFEAMKGFMPLKRSNKNG